MLKVIQNWGFFFSKFSPVIENVFVLIARCYGIANLHGFNLFVSVCVIVIQRLNHIQCAINLNPFICFYATAYSITAIVMYRHIHACAHIVYAT